MNKVKRLHKAQVSVFILVPIYHFFIFYYCFTSIPYSCSVSPSVKKVSYLCIQWIKPFVLFCLKSDLIFFPNIFKFGVHKSVIYIHMKNILDMAVKYTIETVCSDYIHYENVHIFKHIFNEWYNFCYVGLVYFLSCIQVWSITVWNLWF